MKLLNSKFRTDKRKYIIIQWIINFWYVLLQDVVMFTGLYG